MAIPRTSAVPVPMEDLQKIRGYLAPRYGAQVWEGGGRRVLCIRVPRQEPDPVNDLEEAVEYLSPGDTQDLTHCLLLGDRRIESVYTQPLRERMQERVAFDKDQCAALRRELAPHEHRAYVAAKDPRRLVRLALRLPHDSVHRLDDEDVERFVENLGPHLGEERMQAVAAVYLVAGEDDVRLDPGIFLPDLRRRWEDEDRRKRILEEAERKRRDAARRKEEDRRRVLQDLERRFAPQPRVARAPLRRHDGGRTWEAEGGATHPTRAQATAALPVPPAATPPQDAAVPAPSPSPDGPAASPRAGATLHDRVDAVLGAASVGAAPVAPAAPVPLPPAPPPPSTAAVQAPPTADPGAEEPPLWRLMRGRLEEAGYDVVVGPEVPGYTVDLAAERDEGHPRRVVVRFPGRLSLEVAEDMLRTARGLGADLVLAVTDHADHEAERRLVATKGRWLAPRDVEGFGL